MSAAAATFDESDERIDLRKLLVVFSVMLAVLLEIIDTSIVNTALPSMMSSLGATLAEIDWVITGYIISNVIVIPLTGWLALTFGRKRYFTASILLFTFASLMCGLSSSSTALVVWRVIQGLGGGALLSTTQAIMVETFPARQQGTGQAIFGLGAMLGPSLGPTLGGWITDNYSWHWIFLINVPLGLLAAFLCASTLRDNPLLSAKKGAGVDWWGIAFLIIGVGSLQTVLERGHKDDWFDSRLITCLTVSAAVGIVAFIVRELMAEHPVVDLRVLRRKPLAVGCALGVLMGVGLYGSIFLLPVYTQQLLGWTAWQSGVAVLPSTVMTAVMMGVTGRVVWHLGPRNIFVVGMILMPLTMWQMSQWSLSSGWDDLAWPQMMRGFTMALLFIPLSTVGLRSLPSADLAKGSGMYNLFRMLGGSFGVAILSTILDRRADAHLSALAGNVGPFDGPTIARLSALSDRFVDHGLDPSQAYMAAQIALDRALHANAMMQAFYDCYFFIGMLFVITLPAAFLLARHAPGKHTPILD